jgi:uncharacterized protein
MDASFSRAVRAGLVGALTTLKAIVDTAASHVETEGLDPEALLDARLFSDMFPFSRQIAAATGVARRSVDRLSGRDPQSGPKPEPGFDALRDHLDATIAYVQQAPSGPIDASEAAELTAKLGKEAKTFTGRTYLTTFALPNLLFHVVTAYNILRHHGVALGKHDYLGPLIAAR